MPPDADEKEVFELFDKYNLRSLSVVDPEGRPIGVITVDDVVTRLRAHLCAISATERLYRFWRFYLGKSWQ